MGPLREGRLRGKVIKCTLHLRFFRGTTAKKQISSGMSLSHVCGAMLPISDGPFFRSFGITMLETASNIVVPDQ